MFIRFFKYVYKYFKLKQISQSMSDGRKNPLISASAIFWFIFFVFMSQLGKLQQNG